VRVRYATGLTDTVAFDASLAPAGEAPRLLGVVDADRDGRSEVFVQAGSGASTEFVAVLRYVDGRLRLVTLGGRQAMLGSGASVRHADSWACRPLATPVLLWSGDSSDGHSFTGTLRAYRFQGATLVLVQSSRLTATADRPAPTGCGPIRTS
jgi:hypothetical protein